MASSGNGGGVQRGEEEVSKLAAQLGKTLKEGERILAPSRRPDGTYRKPIRIRAGYVPQDEVAIYQSKGALWRKEMASAQEVPPGYDPSLDAKPKSKSAKRNEKKKEKRLQAALDKGKDLEKDENSSVDISSHTLEAVASAASQMNELTLSSNASVATPPLYSTESSVPEDQTFDLDKRIRALKKKIRQTEAQQQKTLKEDMNQEQLEKVTKLDGWREELKLLEEKKAEMTTSSS